MRNEYNTSNSGKNTLGNILIAGNTEIMTQEIYSIVNNVPNHHIQNTDFNSAIQELYCSTFNHVILLYDDKDLACMDLLAALACKNENINLIVILDGIQNQQINNRVAFGIHKIIRKNENIETFTTFLYDALEFPKSKETIRAQNELCERKNACNIKIKSCSDHYKQMIHSIPDIVFRLDATDHIIFVNEFIELLGYQPSELIGKHLQVLLHPDDFRDYIDQTTNDLYDTLLTKSGHLNEDIRTTKLQIRIMKKDVFDLNSATISDDDYIWGEIIIKNIYSNCATENRKIYNGTVGLIRDISERKAIENALFELNQNLENRIQKRTEKLEAINKEQKLFCYSVAHDLQSPLKIILKLIKDLNECNSSIVDSERLNKQKRIHQKIINVNSFVDDMLLFFKSSEKKLSIRNFSMNTVIDECLDLLEDECTGRSISFEVGDLGTIEADYALIRQAIMNLLSNSIKYTANKEHAKVKIGITKKSKSNIEYFIQDNGVGFDDHYSDKIFSVFKRLHDFEEFKGNGIGLAIVKNLIEHHHGRVRAKGRLGLGAIFTVTLPIQQINLQGKIKTN